MKVSFILLMGLICCGLTACHPANVDSINPEIIAGETAVSPTPSLISTPFPTPKLTEETFMITYYQMIMADGTDLEYGVVLPTNYQEGVTYPILLALPPGPQTKSMVYFGIDGYWGHEAQSRGWIVISPIAPNGNLFFRESGKYIPEFLDRIEAIYSPKGDKFYIGGVSNGGISAFHLAIDQPNRFQKIVVLPGFPQQAYFEQLEKISHIPVYMFVGEEDRDWVAQMEKTEGELNRLGGQVFLEVAPNEGHVLHSLTGQRLFDILEAD